MDTNNTEIRIARRDYFENVHLNIRPCPVCESRWLDEGLQVCRHCQTKRRLDIISLKIGAGFLIAIVTFGQAIRYFSKAESMRFVDDIGFIVMASVITSILFAFLCVSLLPKLLAPLFEPFHKDKRNKK